VAQPEVEVQPPQEQPPPPAIGAVSPEEFLLMLENIESTRWLSAWQHSDDAFSSARLEGLSSSNFDLHLGQRYS